jgi:pyruvate-formate lyase
MDHIGQIQSLNLTDRIKRLKDKMLAEPRYLSLEQARLITQSYQANPNLPRILQRAKSLALALERISIRIEPEELIVGNRTPGVKGGVVFPEAGISWLDREIEGLPTRPQDKFNVRSEDIKQFREAILPFWKDKSLEEAIGEATGPLIESIAPVVKINQKDHAQGHICPNTENWLKLGPAGLQKLAGAKLKDSRDPNKRIVYESMVIVLAAAREFIKRYGRLAAEMAQAVENNACQDNLNEIGRRSPPVLS